MLCAFTSTRCKTSPVSPPETGVSSAEVHDKMYGLWLKEHIWGQKKNNSFIMSSPLEEPRFQPEVKLLHNVKESLKIVQSEVGYPVFSCFVKIYHDGS